MAINPEISLGVRTPEIEDPLTSYSKALSVRQMIQQGQLHQQQLQLGKQELQTGAMKNQQIQQSMDEDALVRNAYGEAAKAGGGVDAVRKLLVGKVSPARLNAIDKEILDTKEKLGKIDDQNLKNVAAQNAMVADAGQALLQLPAEQRPAAWGQERQRLIQQGAITADHAPEQYPGDDWIKLNVDHALHADVQFTQEMKRREDTRAQSGEKRAAAIAVPQLAKASTEADVATRQNAAAQLGAVTDQASYAKVWGGLPAAIAVQFPAPGQFDPAKTPAQVRQIGMTAEQQTQATQAAATATEAGRHNKVEEGQGAGRLGVEQGRLTVERRNAGLDANGQPIQYTDAQGNAVNVSPIARQIASYKLPPVSARSYSSNRGLMDQVLAVNPNFDIGAYQERFQTMQDMRPGGKIGQQALALNTLIRHSDDLIDAIGALGNGSFTPANAGYQKLVQIFGGSAPTNFDQLKQFVAGETVKLVRGGGGTGEDEKNAAANISRAGSPKQLLDALKVNFGVAGGKLQALNEATRRAVGDKDFTALDDGASQILKKRGFDTETMKPATAPVKGDKRQYQGHDYQFDGKEWVRK